jgi:uncharacterized protein YkwD
MIGDAMSTPSINPVIARSPRKILVLCVAILVVCAILLGSTLTGHAQAAVTYSTQEVAFVKLLNDYRAAHGLKPVLVSDKLSLAAERHGHDMGKYKFFSHTTQHSDWFPIGSAPWDRTRLSGYSYSTWQGEILAAGQSTAQNAFQAWKSSSGHNAVMLSTNAKAVGVGFATVSGSPYTYYWVCDFGGVADSSAHTLSASSAVSTGATRYQQTSKNIVKVGTWYNYSKTLASGGSYGRSSTSGASATIYFTGTRLDWISMKGLTTGIAVVYLDGVKKATINLASSTAVYNVRVWSTGTLPYGSHKVKVVRSSSSAIGKYITLDAVDIWGTIKAAP